MLHRMLSDQNLTLSVPQVMLDTHFRIWRDVIDSYPTSARLEIDALAHLPALTAVMCLQFTQEHFVVEASVTADTFASLRGRPLYFFDKISSITSR